MTQKHDAAGSRVPLPGLHPHRLLRLMRDTVQRCRLNLSGAVVLTEAATGAYAVTPVLAALAGADRVLCLTRDTRYGTAAAATEETCRLAELAGVVSRLEVHRERSPELFARADVVTNSGHVRPIDRQVVQWLRTGAVVPLMFEAWEAEAGRLDVDLRALAARGIPVAGTNERHPAVDVFSYLAPMATKLLMDAGVAVRGSRILVLCDNPFGPYLESGLRSAGAHVLLTSDPPEHCSETIPDAVLVAMRPRNEAVLGSTSARWMASRWPGSFVTQFWGDLDRTAFEEAGVACWPVPAPAHGHMGILPSGLGPEPVVRLQAGGLKVAEVLRRRPDARSSDDLDFLDEF